MSNAEGCAAIANAGFTALVTQASLSLINNEGDLGAVFDDLSSSDALRSMLTSMATAGTLSAIGGSLASATGLTDGSLAANAANIASEGVISASIDTAINGGSFGDNLTTATLSAAASTINAEFSKKIGQAANNGNINTALQYAAHAVLGCGTAELAGGNCAAGAMGQVTGEAAAQLYSQVTYDEFQNDLKQLNENGDAQAARQLVQDWEQSGLDLAKISGAMASMMVAQDSQDVNLAANNAQSAAEHNALPLLVIGAMIALDLVDKGLLAYDAYRLQDAIAKGNDEEAIEIATELGIGAGIEMATAAIPGTVLGYKILDKLRKIGKSAEQLDAIAKRQLNDIFSRNNTPKASELKSWAESQGWKATQTDNGPLIYIDSNEIKRLSIKKGSPRTPGSEHPHIEVRDASGKRFDPTNGNFATKNSAENHREIDYDL